MTLSYAHGREFVQQVLPFLERGDAEALNDYLARHWPNAVLKQLLTCSHDDAAKAAIVCLSLAGTMADNPVIAPLLHHEDAFTAQLAEHAMWSIWFRAGDAHGNPRLVQAVQHLSQNRLDDAIVELRDVLQRCPLFAEAHNQLAIAHFLKGDYPGAVHHSRCTLLLNSYHFGALAGLGHGYAALGRLREALAAYQLALRLNPRLEGIRQSIRAVRSRLRDRQPAGLPHTQAAPTNLAVRSDDATAVPGD